MEKRKNKNKPGLLYPDIKPVRIVSSEWQCSDIVRHLDVMDV